LRQTTQALLRVVGAGDLGQVELVEQRQLQRSLLDQLLHLRRLQGGDPGHALLLGERLQVGLRDHAPVDHEHDRPQPEAKPELLHLVEQRLVVVDATGEDLDRDRPPLRLADEPVDDLERAAAAVARETAGGKRAGEALEVGGRDVVEDERALAEVAAGKPGLDRRLTLPQPVHRRVELVGVDALDPKLLGQRRLRKRARAGELRGRLEHPLADHRQRVRALRRGGAVGCQGSPIPLDERRHGLSTPRPLG